MRTKAIAILAMALCASIAYGQTFTDVNTGPLRGAGKQKARAAVIDANFALIEGGTVDGSFDEVTVNNTLTAISTNDATTNVIITVNGVIDGETIGDDTIDDDSIDFSDVTGADLTLTDVTALTASGDITANGNILGDGSTIITNIATITIGDLTGVSATFTNLVDVGDAIKSNVVVYSSGVITSITTL